MSEETLFHRVLEQPVERRDEFLAAACGGDDALRRRLAMLLRAHSDPNGFLAGPAVEPVTAGYADPNSPTADHPKSGEPGTVIGPYKLLQRIGEGGMGEVWMVEQTEPVRRQVALKLVKPGMDSKAVLARFEAERQALALMDHPNIAKVLDAGTAAGRPYFVMELVKGVPITKYCDERRLGMRERVELVIQVCRAVQHAHQKGVIHRDLKPSNVLVALYDGRPVPKVIDFGIAKAAGQPLTDKTLFTGFGAVIGTPEYMSPEQAELNQLDVDTRSDVYSLGVVLYELLTGAPPLDHERVRSSSVLEVLRLVREEEPPRPSTRLSSVNGLPDLAAKRGLDPRRLAGAVRGELDWIVMKCLEKDRDRRYQSASSMADDMQRYLNDEQVMACPPSAGYRFRKFARRHKKSLVLAAVFVGLVVAGVVASTWQAYRATQAEARAKSAQADAEANLRRAHRAVNESFTLVSQDVLLREPAMEPLRKKLLQNALRYHQEFVQEHENDPKFRAELIATYLRIAVLMYELGPEEDWLVYCEKGIDALDALLATNPTLDDLQPLHEGSMWVNAGGRWHVSRQDDAFKAFEKGRVMWEKLVRDYPHIPGFRNDLAVCYLALGVMYDGSPRTYPDAIRCYERARELLLGLIRTDPRPHYRTALILGESNISYTLYLAGRADDADAARREVVEVARQLVADYPDSAAFRELQAGYALESSASWLDMVGRTREAEETYRESLAGMQALAKAHPTVGRYQNTRLRILEKLGDHLWIQGKRDEAREAFRQIQAIRELVKPDDWVGQDLLAWFLAACPDTGFRDPRRAVEISTRVNQRVPNNIEFLTTLGVVHYQAGDYSAATRELQEVARRLPRLGLVAQFYLAMTCWQIGDREQARRWYDLATAPRVGRTQRMTGYRILRAEVEQLTGFRK